MRSASVVAVSNVSEMALCRLPSTCSREGWAAARSVWLAVRALRSVVSVGVFKNHLPFRCDCFAICWGHDEPHFVIIAHLQESRK